MSALRWSDVDDAADVDGVLVTVHRGKTNQEGEIGSGLLRRPGADGRGCVKRDVLVVPRGSPSSAGRRSRGAEEVLRIGSAAAAVMRRLPDCGGGP